MLELFNFFFLLSDFKKLFLWMLEMFLELKIISQPKSQYLPCCLSSCTASSGPAPPILLVHLQAVEPLLPPTTTAHCSGPQGTLWKPKTRNSPSCSQLCFLWRRDNIVVWEDRVFTLHMKKNLCLYVLDWSCLLPTKQKRTSLMQSCCWNLFFLFGQPN